MKRKFVSLLLIAMLLCTAFAIVMVGCNDNKVTYSVTILMPDDETPATGITVNWTQSGKTKGSAKTDVNGTATVDLPSGNYGISLSGLSDGFNWTSVTVTSSIRDITMTLEAIMVEYGATVYDKDGNPAKDVTVMWVQNSNVAASVKTNAEGVAKCEIAHGEYSVTVDASTLPEGNIFNGSVTASAAQPNVEIRLTAGSTDTYQVTVETKGGLKYPKVALSVYQGNKFVYAGSTNDEGIFTFSLELGNYRVEADAPQGYTAEPITLSEANRTGKIVMTSSVITSDVATSKKYVIGDVINDFKFTTPYLVDGEKVTYSIADLLKTKKAVIINNWGIGCSWCVREMPAMQEAYEKYKDKIELIALDNYNGGDSESQIVDYRNEYGYTFPMIRDNVGFSSHFNFSGWPTTVIIDRYGVIARIESGAIVDAEVWGRLFERYITDDYVQDFVPGSDKSDSITTEVSKPDIELPADHYEKLAAAINKFPASDGTVTWFGEEDEAVLAWPYLYGKVDGVSSDADVIYASNSGKYTSWAVLYATVNIKAGKVFTFDYYSDTERNSDVLSIIWDGKVIRTISGDSDGWQTCYLYTDLTDGEHSLAFVYQKDQSVDTGKDNVFIRNVRFENVSIFNDEPTDLLRSAAFGTKNEATNRYQYYATVEKDADSYYYVKLNELHNAHLAGNDPKPMLFANLLNATTWNAKSLSELIVETDEVTGEYKYSCVFTINGTKRDYREDLAKYMQIASASYVEDCVPVDDELLALLKQFMANVSGEKSHENEWLEVCYFYSHYGEGEPIGNPIMGLTEKTAIEIGVGTHNADLTRNMMPYAQIIYTFTPSESGVYKFESFIPAVLASQNAAQIWVWDATTTSDKPLTYCGDNYFTRDGRNEHNFLMHMYMTKGHKYYVGIAFQPSMSTYGEYDFEISLVGNSATVLTACAYEFYWQILDDKDNIIGIELAGAVDYEKDEDGFYHALNADGTLGDFIYLDVKNASTIGGKLSIQTMVDKYVQDPMNPTKGLDFKYFDFRYAVAYITNTNEDGTKYYTYTVYNMTQQVSEYGEYKDYTDIMKGYVAEAMSHTGKEEGLVKVNDEIIQMLKLFISLRTNPIWDDAHDAVLENEWLRFCWYYKKFDENNKV